MLAAFRLFLTSIIKSAYKTYFWSDLSSKKSFMVRIGLESTEELKRICLVWISDKWNFNVKPAYR